MARHNVGLKLLRALYCVPSRVSVCAHLTGHGSIGSGGAALTLETGAELQIGPISVKSELTLIIPQLFQRRRRPCLPRRSEAPGGRDPEVEAHVEGGLGGCDVQRVFRKWFATGGGFRPARWDLPFFGPRGRSGSRRSNLCRQEST